MWHNDILCGKVIRHIHNTTFIRALWQFSEQSAECLLSDSYIHAPHTIAVKAGSPVIVAILFFDCQDIHATFQHTAGIVENPTLAPAVYLYKSFKVVKAIF